MIDKMQSFLVLFIFIGQILPNLMAKDYESSLAQANIYYQRPRQLGGPEETLMSDIERLDSKKDIKVIIHGYIANRGHGSIVSIRNAYLSLGIDNVYAADWERAASYDYFTSRNLITQVALCFADILFEFMSKHEIDPDEVHLIGHSLGAHIVGIIGQYFNGTLGRITGLDPALPLFKPQSPDSLQPSNGKFVDIIHTDCPTLGDPTPRGHADFYPNYGLAPQPGCTDFDLFTLTSCSHFRATFLYAESIVMPRSFPSTPCPLSDIFLRRVQKCKKAATLDTDVMMGEYLDKRVVGTYFLKTNAVPPFGFGDTSDIYSKN